MGKNRSRLENIDRKENKEEEEGKKRWKIAFEMLEITSPKKVGKLYQRKSGEKKDKKGCKKWANQ